MKSNLDNLFFGVSQIMTGMEELTIKVIGFVQQKIQKIIGQCGVGIKQLLDQNRLEQELCLYNENNQLI